MRALKILVVVMGIMLVGGFIALIVSIAYMARHRQAPAPVPAAIGAPYTAPPIELPAGARIETMALAGDRLVLNIVTQDGDRELLVLDLASGRRLGTIPLRAAPYTGFGGRRCPAGSRTPPAIRHIIRRSSRLPPAPVAVHNPA